MKVITGIVSCTVRPLHVDAIRETYFSKLPNPFFFRGVPGTSSQRQGDTVLLDCPDTYEHLPRKMWALYEFLLKTEEFDYFLKIDDDCYVHTQLLKSFLNHLKGERRSLTHYMGPRILNPAIPRSNVWHIGKVSDPTYSQEYRRGFENSYCSGGTGYILSRRAMEIIVERGREHFLDDAEIYEDKCHGDVLMRHGVFPTLMPPNIIVSDLKPEQINEQHRTRPNTVGRKVQLGCGPNRILGWENYDMEIDIRKPLPWENGSIKFIFAEHVVEHVTPSEAWNFFKECRRTLQPSGVLRVVVPSIVRIVERWNSNYLAFVRQHGWGNGSIESAAESIITNHGHQAIWSSETLQATLKALGFATREYPSGQSDEPELRHLEMHGLQIGEEFNRLESICIEASRPGPSFSLNVPPERQQKLAFLFLTRTEPNQSGLWSEFFADHSGEYSVYMHAKHPESVKLPFWRRSLISQHLPTKWGTVSLVQATLALLREAFRDPYNSKFALLSESCVPIKPFSIIQETLYADERGRMYWETPAAVVRKDPDKIKRFTKIPALPPEHQIFHDQWLVLNREMAGALLEHDWTPYFEETFAPDECYFASVLSAMGFDLTRHFQRMSVTHSQWNGKGPHPYQYSSLNNEDIKTLRDSKCLFARKFSPASNIKGIGLHVRLQ
jgi:predicted SAM-dependent methyltransferase